MEWECEGGVGGRVYGSETARGEGEECEGERSGWDCEGECECEWECGSVGIEV